MLKIFIFCLSCLCSLTVVAHPGTLDANGGHKQKSSHTYHCHKPSCSVFSAPRAAKSAVKSAAKSSQQNKRNIEFQTRQAETEGRAFSSLYNRTDWPHWIDEDDDCQNTRAEILIATSRQTVKFKRNKGCNVSHGEWFDPYTGKIFHNATELDIDHVVPLSWAHKHGAANWSREQKRAFANDPENLMPVERITNQEKGDKGPDIWMPPNRFYWNDYRERFELITRKYNLKLVKE